VTQNHSSSEPSTSNLLVLQVEGEKCRSYSSSTSPSGTGSEAAATKSCDTFDLAFRRQTFDEPKTIAYLQWTMPDDRRGKIAVITIVDVYGSFPMHELDNTQKEKIANSMLNAENANPA
jgi:hypothetical protein